MKMLICLLRSSAQIWLLLQSDDHRFVKCLLPFDHLWTNENIGRDVFIVCCSKTTPWVLYLFYVAFVVCRRTRSIFDVVVRVVQSIQRKDMEAGRSIGNSVLRWLDPTKPSAQVGVHSGKPPISSICISKYAASRSQLLRTGRSIVRITDQVKRGRSFFTPWNIPMKTFPTIGMMMQPMKPAGLNGQYRHASRYIPNSSAIGHSRIIGGAEGVLRKDIAQWMLHTWWAITSKNLPVCICDDQFF